MHAIRQLLIPFAASLAACQVPVPVAPASDAGTIADAGVADGGPTDAGPRCGSSTCSADELCCEQTQTCYARSCLSCCEFPMIDGGLPEADAGITCLLNSDCGHDEWCNGIGCGTPGICEPIPGGCPQVYRPVCGCDGQTYPNDCVAAWSGQRSTDGACPSPDAGVDGGISGACLDNSTCELTQYCLGDGCGTPGTCQMKPDRCSNLGAGVCGCDGQTYTNGCQAGNAGVRVAMEGPCPSLDGGAADAGADCTTNTDCAAGSYCAGDTCDGPGVCDVEPRFCPEIASPVCGCDGQNYGNPCEAAAGGARVASSGQCAADGGVMCGRQTCGADQVCCRFSFSCVPANCPDCCPPP